MHPRVSRKEVDEIERARRQPGPTNGVTMTRIADSAAVRNSSALVRFIHAAEDYRETLYQYDRGEIPIANVWRTHFALRRACAGRRRVLRQFAGPEL